MRKKIGELLVEAGATTLNDVNAALGSQRAKHAGQKLGQVLVSMGRVTHQQVARALSVQFDLPFIELPQIPASVSLLVPMDFQTEHRIVPFQLEREGRVERLHLAIADPSSMDLVDEIRFQLGKPIRVFVAALDDIDDVLSALKGDAVAELDVDDSDDDVDVDMSEPEPAAPAKATAPAPADDWSTAEPPVALGAPVAAAAPADDWSIEEPPVAVGAPVADAAPAVELPPEWGDFGAPPAAAPPPPPTATSPAARPAPVAVPPANAARPAAPPPPPPAAPVSAAPSPNLPSVSASLPPPSVAPAPASPSVAPVSSAPSVAPMSSVPTVAPVSSTPSVAPLSSAPSHAPGARPPSLEKPVPLAVEPPKPTPPSATKQPTRGSAMASASDLDDLLGEATAIHAPSPDAQPLTRPALPPPPGQRAAHVHKFDTPPRTTPSQGTPAVIPGATTSAPPPSNLGASPAAEAAARIDFSEEDLKILENLERMALGDEPTMDSAKVKPAQMVASLIRLLMKKGVIAETEFLEELGRK